MSKPKTELRKKCDNVAIKLSKYMLENVPIVDQMAAMIEQDLRPMFEELSKENERLKDELESAQANDPRNDDGYGPKYFS